MLAGIVPQDVAEQAPLSPDGPPAGQRLAQQHGPGCVQAVTSEQRQDGQHRAGDELRQPGPGDPGDEAAALQERKDGVNLEGKGGRKGSEDPRAPASARPAGWDGS